MPILSATYHPPQTYFKIPEEWELKDIKIYRGELYYKGEKKDVPSHEMEEEGHCPEQMKIEDEGDYDFLFE